MTTRLDVVFERGVLRPLQPLPFAENQRLTVTVTDEQGASRSFNPREKEQQWLSINRAQYAGKWVALEEDRLLSHGESALEVLKQARAQGVRHPLLVQVPREPSLPFGGW